MAEQSAEVEGVELSKAIAVVRDQLIEARTDGRVSGAAGVLTFDVGKVSVEFVGEVRKTAGADAGVKFWVVNAAAKGEFTSGATQRVTVELIPRAPDGSSFRVNDDVTAPPSR